MEKLILNKTLTKYLTETRKIYKGDKYRNQRGMKNVEVYDVYQDDSHVKSIILDKKHGNVIDELGNSFDFALHQIDFIRLQNELDVLDKMIN